MTPKPGDAVVVRGDGRRKPPMVALLVKVTGSIALVRNHAGWASQWNMFGRWRGRIRVPVADVVRVATAREVAAGIVLEGTK